MMNNSDRFFLLDCDGVLADFCSAFMDWARTNVESRLVKSEILACDLFASITPKEKDKFWRMVDTTPGWVESLKVRPGAEYAVERLRLKGVRVICVTSPHAGPTWMWERHQWLQHNLGFAKDDIAQKSDKSREFGHAFVDDWAPHLTGWKGRFVGRTFHMQELGYKTPDSEGHRPITDWNAVIEYAEGIL